MYFLRQSLAVRDLLAFKIGDSIEIPHLTSFMYFLGWPLNMFSAKRLEKKQEEFLGISDILSFLGEGWKHTG